MKKLYLVIALFAFVALNEIKAQEITQFPGFFGAKYYEDDNRISKKQVESLMLKNVEAHQLWQKSKKHNAFGWIALGVEIGFLGWFLENNDIVPLVGVLGSAAVSIGFSFSSANLKKKAILKYNNIADVGTLKFGPTYNGLGLVYQFR